ncbi:MAG TPA: DUF6531 domain-containing protein, partial [Solirubrobacterales bacterium]|nr:DUF6531 domain-containing protein [Solirubrobacterales bacterium]
MFLVLVCGVATASGAGAADLTVAEEKSLLENVFAPQLEAIDADPARALSGIVLNRIDSPTEALVTMDGHRVLLESEIPLRAPEEDGDLSKVDLALEEDAAGGYSPANPLVELTLPESADEPIAIGEDGLTLSLQGAAQTSAAPLGEEDLLLPEAREDTSLLLSPISGGVELSAMLLSPASPQQLSFAVNLPNGERLRSREDGGAEILDPSDEVVARVTAPHAFDADGEEVPVELAVEGDSLILSVPHREADVAYPLFVDPEVIENWEGFTDTGKLNYWFWQYGGVGPEDFIGWRSCISTCWGNGLYLRARSNTAYPAGSYGRWGFVPQGTTTFMRRVIFGPIHMNAYNCFGNEPHGYVGVWNTAGFWSVLGNAYPTGYVTWIDTGEGQNLGAGARTAYVAMHASSAANIKCGRDYQLGGATLFLDDPEGPTVGAPTGYPGGWVKDGTSFTVNVPVSDPGLGVKSATIWPDGAASLGEKELTCAGSYANQCPANHTFGFTVSSDSFDQGEKEARASAKDVVGHSSNTSSWTMKVDRTPPEVELGGQLAEATDETEGDAKDPEKWDALTLPVYNLQIDATDGSTASAATKRSGVKSIEVFLDQKATPEKTWTEASCPASSCPMSRTFTLKLNELSADTHHTLRVVVRDFAGNTPRESNIEFEYIPATGMKDEYVLQYFPLPDGQGSEDEEERPSRPELAVNVVSGNLVYRQTDAEVQGVGADLGLDLYYNSLLPTSQNSEWGDGWTLSQTPGLELEEPEGPGPVDEATILEESGAVESKVELPASVGEEEFDKRLQATLTKEAGGEFALSDESGESDETLVFDETGRVQEARTGSAATVDYDYEGGNLTGLAIEDPGTAMVAPGSLEEDAAPSPPALAFAANLGTSGSGDGQLKTPADVLVDPQGNLWALDRGNARVQKFDSTGQFLAKFGSAGTAEGQLNNPSALAMDAAGNLLVAENYRVQKFSPSGQPLAKFGSFGLGQGQFFLPSGIAVSSDGSIWVADSTRVQRFSAAGQFIEQVGASGTGQVLS